MAEFFTHIKDQPFPNFKKISTVHAFGAYVARCGGDPVKTIDHFRFLEPDLYANFDLRLNQPMPLVGAAVVGKAVVGKAVVNKAVVGKAVVVNKAVLGKAVVGKAVVQLAIATNGVQRLRLLKKRTPRRAVAGHGVQRLNQPQRLKPMLGANVSRRRIRRRLTLSSSNTPC